MSSPTRVPGSVWVAVWMTGLVATAIGARLFSVAVDGYLSANPNFYGDFYHVPAPSPVESGQASLAAFLFFVGAVAVLVSSLTMVKTTAGGWLLLRSVGDLIQIPIGLALAQPGLQGYFQMYVDTLCGDCGPPAPDPPPFDAFATGVTALAVMVLASLAASLVLAVLAIRSFQRPASSPLDEQAAPGDHPGPSAAAN